jgi:hypothetical protein
MNKTKNKIKNKYEKNNLNVFPPSTTTIIIIKRKTNTYTPK